ncbi:MAG: hypothetical protein ACKO96_34875, partial [Flammeovirgaceae bacterium]
MGMQVRIDQSQAMNALRAVDQNNDGQASKIELLNVFRSMLQQQGKYAGGQQGFGQQGGWGQG